MGIKRIIEEVKDANNQVKELLQRQVDHEFENERLYFSMALWCDMNGYPETAKFFSGHSIEEKSHGVGFIHFMLQQRMEVITPYTTGIARSFSDIEDVLLQSIDRERETSKMIATLYKTSIEEGSLASTVASKYLLEQVEEEQLFTSIYNLWKLCNGNKIDFEMEIGTIKSSGKYKLGEI